MSIKTLALSARLPFLILTPVCILLGFSLSLSHGLEFDYLSAALIMLGALSAHISVNALNEYFDFKSGLDLITDKTPFSGGSGALPANPDMARVVLFSGLFSLMLTMFIGLYFISRVGVNIIPIGVVGVVIIVSYTQWINRQPIICLLAPGLGFGILMVCGTQVALAGENTGAALLLSLVPFFLVNNLLLLNQFPDIDADRKVGRRTFPISYGSENSTRVYIAFAIVAYSLVIVCIGLGILPLLAVIALIPAVLSAISAYGMHRYSFKIAKYPQYFAANVGAAVLTPALLASAIFLST